MISNGTRLQQKNKFIFYYQILKKISVSFVICFTVVNLCACQSLWHLFLNCVVEIAPKRFTFKENHQKLSIPIHASHNIKKNDPAIKYLVVMIHGGGLNAAKAFETGHQIIDALNINENRVLLIAPQFIEGVDTNEKGLLFWDRKWRSGGKSLSTGPNIGLPVFSSFEVLDRLINTAIKNNTNIQRIIILGHSAGGQYVLRYAALNDRHEILKLKETAIQYVVANPSSYLYLSNTRYLFNSKKDIEKVTSDTLKKCSNYNRYKYGLDDLNGYAEFLSSKVIRHRLLTRPIIFLLGTKDKKRNWSLDKSCRADLQGRNRFERGVLYRHHLNRFWDDISISKHIWLELAGSGHDSNAMLTHPQLITLLNSM